MASLKKVLGIPRQSPGEQEEHEVVKTPEFDLTQFAKILGPAAVAILVAIFYGLKKLVGVDTVTDPAVLVGALGVVAAAVLGMCFVMAIDIAARAFLSGEGSAQKKKAGDGDGSSANEVIAAPAGMQAWLEGGGPYPVLAMSGDGEQAKYLVATGSIQERTVEGANVKALDGTVEWCEADEVRAIRSDKWP
jgi:hypothetical protein